MKKLLLAATMLTALAGGANAQDNLNIITIPDPDVVPQSQSSPCIICATNQAHNPITFGYNNFTSTGNISSFNMFSTNLFATVGDGIRGTTYTAGQIINIVQAIDITSFSFAVAVDINTTGAKSEYLDLFQLINLGLPGTGDEEVIFQLSNVALPGIHNGNGAADYLITGFDLSGINVGDRLLFRAQWHGAVDGGESFYIVPTGFAVPGPAVGAFLPTAFAGLGLLGFNWFRRRRLA